MRVSKRIAEYVEQEVAKAIPYGAPTDDYKATCVRMNELQSEVNTKVVEYAKKLCAEATATLPEGFFVKLHTEFPITTNSYNSPMQCAATSHERKVREQRKKAVDSILISLELGATRAELATIMKEVIAEVTAE